MPSQPRDERVWGIDATNNSFRVFCVNPRCPFAAGIPDLIGRRGSVRQPSHHAGRHGGQVCPDRLGAADRGVLRRRPDPGPALIIQDEFHLISGPLGTIVGLYEAAFDVLMARNGARPKIVAATATIRRADQQTRGVFGRDVALFPPAGIDADDSYFVRMVTDKPGRLMPASCHRGIRR